MNTSTSSGREPGRLPIGPIALGLVLCYLPMWLTPALEVVGVQAPIRGHVWGIMMKVLAVALVLAHLRWVKRRPLTSIGLSRPTRHQLELALYLFGAAMLWQWAMLRPAPPPPGRGAAEIVALPVLTVVLLILSAAVCEEILHRGYPLARLAELTGRRWIGYLVTVPIFVVPHVVTFGPSWLWTSGAGTLAIYVLYARTRNLPACMLLHLCLNLPILIPTIAARV